MMKGKSSITTAKARELLAAGWKLKEHKNNFCGHSYYIWDERQKGRCGSALYVNRDVWRTLVSEGHVPISDIKKGRMK